MYNFGQNTINPYQQANPYQLQQMQDRLNQYTQPQQYQQPMQQYQQPQQQYQQPMQQAPAGNVIKPVTSLEEVRGITPNFDGSKMYFEDVASKKLYIKYIDLNGLPITQIYSLDTKPAPTTTETVSGDFVSKEEFNNLKAEIEQYKGLINQFLSGGATNESK